MKVIVYKCNLCEQSYEKKYVFGVAVEDEKIMLVDPEDSDKHICKGCIAAIQEDLEGLRI